MGAGIGYEVDRAEDQVGSDRQRVVDAQAERGAVFVHIDDRGPGVRVGRVQAA